MKKNIFFLPLFITSFVVKAQNDTTYIQDCYKITERKISNNRIVQFKIDTCNKKSIRGQYSTKYKILNKLVYENGVYFEYWDDHFGCIKLNGYFKIIEGATYVMNSPSGVWQEYYPNGYLLSEGQCKTLFFLLRADTVLNQNKILMIDELNPLDTVYLNYNQRTIDSLKGLVIYNGVNKLDIDSSKDYKASIFSNSYPSVISVKIGEWNYYNEKGQLIRKEYYSGGRLIKSIY
ncbi:hypothetical protein [Ferruginibacter albus]|uniref:hypothetical protein n=1 Tax=Ferruginibacter albus TaxID=2875540 RepID=UPI001CC40899|nr:hypothetical protein [Ferruginibacter albus]UAY52836.1 hypothetical protein K9M53_03945 [Ferruginibacter albus]